MTTFDNAYRQGLFLVLSLLLMLVCGKADASESNSTSIPEEKHLDLGGGVRMEFVLIRPRKFLMGTDAPAIVHEHEYRRAILVSKCACLVGIFLILVVFIIVAKRSIRGRRRFQFSLGVLTVITLLAGISLLSGVAWNNYSHQLQEELVTYEAAKDRYDSTYKSEKPAHLVSITRPFYLGKFPVTQEQYKTIMGAEPSKFSGERRPVESVSWIDAQKFCKRVAERFSLLCRLPSEAEWEFSCRAGTDTAYYSGNSEIDLDRVAWYERNSDGSTHNVGEKRPNVFGLYDMHGNVWQWCSDWYDENYYQVSPIEDPRGPNDGAFRVLRGGSWNNDSFGCRSAARRWDADNFCSNFVGFRVLVEAR